MLQKVKLELGVAKNTWNPRTSETEEGGVQHQPGLLKDSVPDCNSSNEFNQRLKYQSHKQEKINPCYN